LGLLSCTVALAHTLNLFCVKVMARDSSFSWERRMASVNVKESGSDSSRELEKVREEENVNVWRKEMKKTRK